jgi:hypothetical protein
MNTGYVLKNKKIFLNEVLAKRCSSIGQKLDYKKRLLNFMYKKSFFSL